MTDNKRFKMEFHDVSHDELEENYSYYRVVESCISDNGEFMSYGQIETTLNNLYDENEQLKKALLFYIDVALCETSSNFNKDFDNICNNLFGCSYNEIKHLYSDISVEDDVFALFQR